MTLPCSAADVLADHVLFEIEAIDRMYLNLYQPRLQHGAGIGGDTAAGYQYELSVLPAEFSLTQTLDAPVTGRIFFDQLIRDNLDLGRPDRISLIFDHRVVRRGRHPTPGRFRTRVITEGVTPSLHIDYKNSKIKQYHKLGKALRTETTINDS